MSGSTRGRTVMVAVGMALVVMALALARRDGGESPLVVTDTGGTAAVGPGVDRPAQAVAWPNSATATAVSPNVVVDPGVEAVVETDGTDVKVPGHAESTRRHTVSAEGAGGGVVVTNSGSAVAHSGGNSEVSGGNGDVASVESGDVHAEGNRSTTHVGP